MSPTPGRRRALRSALLAASAAAVVAISGCAGGETTADGEPIPSVQDLYSKVRATSLEATSGHVTGFMSDDKTGDSIRIDLEGKADGSNQRARISDDRKGVSTLLTVKGRTYVFGDWDFWATATEPKLADSLKGKQVLVNPKELSGLEKLTMGGLMGTLFENEKMAGFEGITSKVTLRREDDRDVWVISDRDVEIWVDRETGELMKISTEGDDASDLTFDRWNEAKTFKAPSRSKVIKL